ncbi:MAG: 4-(cytidine 5'-diphospho)-2-C-methyl-D-erythritol kinase [Deltaproteobacteria bacterium]|nr:4-(cytidine 5'-diphospho)-2-C-methyl-D-erythritol kinase [Deltaproteobacteria bacterium]
MRIRAPAKVNLYLRIVGKRRDGYHLLDTIMVPVSLYDEIEITRPKMGKGGGMGKGSLTVTCDHPQVPRGRKNLAYQAASLLLGHKGIRDPVRIHIQKRIPVGGGLGGGSSDAAATLHGLNRLFRLGSGRSEILSLGASLGADVPFFIYGHPARARGIGEKLEPLPVFPRLWMVILYPGFPVSTRWVYQNLVFKLTKPIENIRINFSCEHPKKLRRLLVNDLERVTIRRYPRIAFLKERLLQEGATGALMSGSGSSVFGIFTAGQRARKAFFRLRKEEGVQAYLVRSLS